MRISLRQRQILWAYGFLTVSLIFFITIRWYPTLLAINISFRDWNVLKGAGPWVGLENYRDIWDDLFKPRSAARAAFINTIKYVVYGVPLQMVVSLGVALLLMQIRRLSGFFRAAYFIPYVTSAVAVAFVWNWLYAPQSGLINQVLAWLGMPTQPFLQSPNQALMAITVVAVWQGLGFSIIIFLAGLQQIPGNLLRGRALTAPIGWQIFWRITLPLLNPVIVYLSVLSDYLLPAPLCAGAKHEPRGAGGPLNSTTTVVLEVYKEGFASFNMGYAAALTVVLFVIILIITVVQLRLLTRVEY